MNTKNDSVHWAEALADEVLGVFPDQKEYTAEAGISPSGVVHFGNFRDLITAFAVQRALARKGKLGRLLFFWDDYDRFRKVPDGVDPKFSEHIGKPLSEVPDPEGDPKLSYAKRYMQPFEAAIQELGIKVEYLPQSQLYQSGAYDDRIIEALQKREQIAEILFSLMSDKAKQAQGIEKAKYVANYYPVQVYSKETGKDTTRIVKYDGKRTITYEDVESGKQDQVVIGTDRNLKLAWKTHWPLLWVHEGVNFEPGGSDHLSPGSSYDAGVRIIREVFGGVPPVTTRYGMVGLRGVSGKMSGSAGGAVSLHELLDVYTAPMLKWLYLRTLPRKNFSLAFDTEIFRQYDEFDREIADAREGKLDDVRRFALEESFEDGKVPAGGKTPVPFRQLVSFGQIVQWDEAKLRELFSSLKLDYDSDSIRARLPKARNWLEVHNPDQLITLLDKPNAAYAKQLSAKAKENVAKLHEALSAKGGESVSDLEQLVYDIPKDPKASDEQNRAAQRAFFTDVYQLLIGKDAGPRLGTFLWAVDRERVRTLLEV